MVSIDGSVAIQGPGPWFDVTAPKFGAFPNGVSRPLSSKYGSLAAAQVDYPFATTLTQEFDWAAIVKAILAARVTYAGVGTALGMTVFLPPGLYNINSPIPIDSVRFMNFTGCGAATVLRYNGAAGTNMFEMSDCKECVFRNFCVTAAVTTPGFYNATFHSVNGAGVIYIPSSDQWERILWLTTGWTNNFLFDATGAGGGSNNENHKFFFCVCGASEAAWKIAQPATQVHNLEMYGCNCTASQYVVYAPGTGGNIIWHGGSGGTSSIADFSFGDSLHHVLIDGWNSEGSSRLIMALATGQQQNVTVRGCRWAGTLNVDGYYALATGGPLVLDNNEIFYAGGGIAGASPPMVHVYSGADPNTLSTIILTHTNNRYRSATPGVNWPDSGAVVQNRGRVSVVEFNNSYYNPDDGLRSTIYPLKRRSKGVNFGVAVNDRCPHYLCNTSPTATLCLASDLLPGDRKRFTNTDSGTTTVTRAGADAIGRSGATTYALVGAGKYVEMETDGVSLWDVVSNN